MIDKYFEMDKEIIDKLYEKIALQITKRKLKINNTKNKKMKKTAKK